MPEPPVAPPPVASLLDLSASVVIVTGASRGIGAGIAERLAEAGAAVIVQHRDSAAQAEEVAARIQGRGGRALVAQGDVSQAGDIERVIAAALGAFGHLDGVVNNAGVQPVQPLLDTGVEDWDALMAVNLRGIFLSTQLAARQMMQQGGGGAIVNIASIEGVQSPWVHAHFAV